MRRGYLTLTTPVALVLVILTAGCGGTPASPATETTTASADTTTQPANPDDLDGRYWLMPGTRLNIESTGASWPAGSGVLAVTKLDNGDLQLSAEAVTKKAGDRSWALDLTVTSIGRAVRGTVVSEGVTWRVQPNTGVITAVTKGDAVTISSLRAVTITARGDRTPGPMTFVLTGRTSSV